MHGAMACDGCDASGGNMRKCLAPLSACMLYLAANCKTACRTAPDTVCMCVSLGEIGCSCTWVERWWCRLVPCAHVALTLLPLPMRLHASRAGVALLAGASFVASSSGECCMSRLHDRKRGSMISAALNPRSHHAERHANQTPTSMQPFRRARRRASRVARLRSHNADTRPPSRALRRACR